MQTMKSVPGNQARTPKKESTPAQVFIISIYVVIFALGGMNTAIKKFDDHCQRTHQFLGTEC